MPARAVTEVSTLGDLLLRAAHDRPDHPALILPSQQANYRELERRAVAVARSLIAMGVARGAHVALLLPNSVEYVEALFGVLLAGCVAVPLNTRHKAAELGYIIADAQVSAILTCADAQDPVDLPVLLVEAMRGLPTPPPIALLAGSSPGHGLDREAFLQLGGSVSPDRVDHARQAVRLRDTALIIYTSGTTAHPKGCMLSHEAASRGPVERARTRLSTGGRDVTWAAGPLFHIGSLAPLIGSIGAGGTFLADRWFDPGRALDLMARHNVTLAWPWFPAIVQGLIDHPSFSPRALSHLRYLFLIGPVPLAERVQDLLPDTETLQACGMTETAGIFALSNEDEGPRSRVTTQGRPAPGVEVRIVDPDSRADLPDGQMGEILVRGYNVMDGYWAAPDKTREALSADGWLSTGDLYTRCEGGALVFGGRLKDMLKVGGENVAALEIESFLQSHPAVKTAEVVGRPDPRLDEVPIAFVELYPGHEVDEAALIAHCRDRIARYKIPRSVIFVMASDWPMSATKIDKRALRARLA